MQITLQNQFISATILSKGAELCSLQSKTNGREYLWQADPAHWAKHSPVLFPIVGKLKENSYSHLEKTYSLPRHGFAREMEFLLIEQSESKAVFELCSSAESKVVYPFDFEFRICYHLDQNELHTTYMVKNSGNETLYYNVGAHPAFALPLDFTNYSLVFPGDSTMTAFELEQELICNSTHQIQLEKHSLPLSYSLFKKDALVFKQLDSKLVTLFENNQPLLQVSFADFPNLGIWTKPQAPFICIEPWLGFADTIDANGILTDKEGIQLLAVGEQKTLVFTTTLFA